MSKIARRDISPFLQEIRNFLLGVSSTKQFIIDYVKALAA